MDNWLIIRKREPRNNVTEAGSVLISADDPSAKGTIVNCNILGIISGEYDGESAVTKYCEATGATGEFFAVKLEKINSTVKVQKEY